MDLQPDGGPARVVRAVPAPATAGAPFSVTFSVDQSGRGSTTISKGQLEVEASLQRLGFSTVLEFKFATQGGCHWHSVDIAAALPDAGLLVAVEFDGPSHYRYLRRQRTAKSVMRDRIIRRSRKFAGLVVVPYFKWGKLRRNFKRQDAYLAARLRRALSSYGWRRWGEGLRAVVVPRV